MLHRPRSGESREVKAAVGTSDSISTDAVCKDREASDTRASHLLG